MGLLNPLPGVPLVESPFFEEIAAAKGLPPEVIKVGRNLRRDGFAVIDFPDPQFETTAEHIIRTLDRKFDWAGWKSGAMPNLRVQDAWSFVPEVKRIACNQQVLDLLTALYGRRTFPFQTLNFPVGTQQHYHSDSIHFSSSPERFMVGVWVALEDVDGYNGPLIYYPGSHTLPIFTNEHLGINPDPKAHTSHYSLYLEAWEGLVRTLGLKPAYFYARKGQALIWAANLLHGGAPQKDLNRTRHSQVTHYYFDHCSYYTPMISVPFLSAIHFKRIVDISTGKPVVNTVNGVEVPEKHIKYSERRQLETRKAPTRFDRTAYLRANPDLARNVDPAKHWVEQGHREGRPLR